MSGPRTPARAEVVGSLLRPPALRAAVEAFYGPGHSAVLPEERAKDRSALRELEDAAIREVVRRQVDLGIDVITDGEFRRWMFLNSFYDAVEGFRTDNVVHFRNARGEDVPLAVHEIVERLRLVDSPAAREAAFMAEVAGGHPFKVTFPAASIFGHPFSFKPGVTTGYEDLEAFVAHAIEIERGLVADAIAAGARYVQFDFLRLLYVGKLAEAIWCVLDVFLHVKRVLPQGCPSRRVQGQLATPATCPDCEGGAPRAGRLRVAGSTSHDRGDVIWQFHERGDEGMVE